MKTLKITKEAHDRLKDYCKKNFLKMNEWTSHIIIEYIDKRESGDGKKKNRKI